MNVTVAEVVVMVLEWIDRYICAVGPPCTFHKQIKAEYAQTIGILLDQTVHALTDTYQMIRRRLCFELTVSAFTILSANEILRCNMNNPLAKQQRSHDECLSLIAMVWAADIDGCIMM